jgi:hypothetical protein
MGGGGGGGCGGGGGQSSFPIKDDAGYIGYLTDSDSDSDNRVDALSRIVRDRRRVLLGSDCDFTMTFVVMVIVVLVVVMATLVVGSAIIKH